MGHLGGSADETPRKVYELYHRHGKDVVRVVEEGLTGHVQETVKRSPPEDCLLRMVHDPSVPAGHVLEQELALHWVVRMRRYDPRRASIVTYASRALDSRIIDLVRHARAARRDRRREWRVEEVPVALLVSINLKWPVEQVRSANLLCELYRHFSEGPELLARCAFPYGREYGRWECGAVEEVGPPDPQTLPVERKGWPDLKEQPRELKQVAADCTLRAAETLKHAIGVANAAEVLSQWEGFGRFCRKYLGPVPMSVMGAYRLLGEDPAAQVLAVYPDAAMGDANAAEWEGKRGWGRRFTAR